MASRDDVDIDFNPSPRIATVDAPSTEFFAQDVVDTLRVGEETFRGISETKLLDAAGKENLGGGVQVGITTTLQNTQIAFEGRTTPAQIGTVTTASNPPVSGLIDLYDTLATFEANVVTRGSLVVNFTDQSIAEVYSVENETHLRTRTLVNGTDNQFDFGDDYQVFNVIQCEVLGGNVVAVDNDDLDISPVLPTAFTQIVRTSSSSATLTNNASTEEIAVVVAQKVWVEPSAGSPSTTYGDLISNVDTNIKLIQIDITNVLDVVAEVRKYSQNRSFINDAEFTLTIYEDNGTTPFKVFDLKDENGVASITKIFERIPQ